MNRPISHWVLLFALVAMWGSAFMMTGIAVRGLTPSTLVAVRLLIAAVMLTAIALLLTHTISERATFLALLFCHLSYGQLYSLLADHLWSATDR